MSLKEKTSLTIAAGMLAAACGGAAQAPPPPQQKPAAAVVDGAFGVKECDDYIRKYLACVDTKVPEAARAMVRQGFEQTKASWKQAASTPAGKTSLAAACTQAEAAAKQAMAAYGCQW